jgi:hypothetical protein
MNAWEGDKGAQTTKSLFAHLKTLNGSDALPNESVSRDRSSR